MSERRLHVIQCAPKGACCTHEVRVSDDAYISLLMGLGGAFTDVPAQGGREAYLLSHYPTACDLWRRCTHIIAHEAHKWA